MTSLFEHKCKCVSEVEQCRKKNSPNNEKYINLIIKPILYFPYIVYSI